MGSTQWIWPISFATRTLNRATRSYGAKKYGLHNLHTLPTEIKLWSNNIRSSLLLRVWFGILSPFSNFLYSPMIIKKKYFLFAEQFIQYAKAILFGDEFTVRRTLFTKDPYTTCKRLSYKIKGFDQSEWDPRRHFWDHGRR